MTFMDKSKLIKNIEKYYPKNISKNPVFYTDIKKASNHKGQRMISEGEKYLGLKKSVKRYIKNAQK